MGIETALTDYKCKYCGRTIKEGFQVMAVPKKKGGGLYGATYKYHPECYRKVGRSGQKKAKSKKDKHYYWK